VTWVEYIRGVAAVLERNGIRLRGADIFIDSDIPLGGGLSSSASLELVIARALVDLANESVPVLELAKMCQQAEHEFAHVQCGIMDQYTIACAREDSVLLLDCRTLEAREVPIPADIVFIVTDSGVRHRLPDGDYNSRGDECATAMARLRNLGVDLQSLRDLTPELLADNEQGLGDLLFRRCRHVVSENDRVQQVVSALEANDVYSVGELVTDCHMSLRNDYEVSCKELDVLVEIANGCDGVHGSRMVGAGFGGCVLSVTTKGKVDRVRKQIGERYAKASGILPWQHIVEPANGVVEVQDE
jgi:galactokinase